MTEPARIWPKQLEHLLAALSASDHPGCYHADVEVTDAELAELNLFEAGARHHKVAFPAGGRTVTGSMNVVLGLGPPADRTRHAGRVRISFCDAEP